MSANKVIIDGVTVIDLTSDTASPETVAEGETFHTADGDEAVGKMALGKYYTIAIPSATDTDLKGWTAYENRYELQIMDVAWMTEDLFIELKCENSAVFTEHNLRLYQDNGFLDFAIDSLPEMASTLYIVVPNYTYGGALNGGDA